MEERRTPRTARSHRVPSRKHLRASCRVRAAQGGPRHLPRHEPADHAGVRPSRAGEAQAQADEAGRRQAGYPQPSGDPQGPQGEPRHTYARARIATPHTARHAHARVHAHVHRRTSARICACACA
eukprot:6451067-Prymnesium_polylepis.1